jgi:ABC-2 type transport system permease protein
MRLFWEIVKRAFARHLTYRTATVTGLITNLFFGVLRASVLLALLSNSSSAGGWNAQQIVTYVALTQAIMMVVSIFGWTELMNTVYRGEIAAELLRPTSLYTFWFAQDIGRSLTALLTRGISIMLVCWLFLRIQIPNNALHWLSILASLGLAMCLSFAFRFMVNLAAFWSPDARGMARFAFVILGFASGFLMPLRFFPDWLQDALALTPFPHMMNSTIEIYIGSSNPLELLGLQTFWTIVLTIAAHLILARATKRLVILGG